MKNPNAFKALLTVVAIFLVTLLNQALAQVQTPRFGVSMSSNTHGFYEYLPKGYSASGTQTWPLIVALHGVGEEGDGSTGSLPMILRHGPAKVIDQGIFPTSFTVNGQTFSFIVISPQFVSWPSASDVDQVINYAVANYKVDQSRIYVTGLSMGGGVTWDYAGSSSAAANRIAAIVPISGASYPDMTRSRTMAAANLPVWALHNQGDPTVTVTNTTGYVANINLAPSPNPLAKMTIFNQNYHDAWTPVYDMSYTEGGMNVYQWMLQYKRGGSSTTSSGSTSTNLPPVSNPGAGQTITLPTNSVNLNGSGSTDPDGTISSYQWLQVVGPNNATFSNTNTANTTVSNLVAGTYTFRLIVTDNAGATNAQTVNIVVNQGSTTTSSSTSGSVIHVEAENYSAMNSVMTQTTSDVGGGLNVGGANTGSWMDYNVNVPTAGTYTLKVRIATPNTGQLQFKAADGTVLGTVTIPSTNGWQSWATFTTNVTLPAGSQKLRIYDASGAWNFNWFELAPSSTTTTTTTTTTPPATGSTIHVEAETYSAFNSAMTQTTSDVGGGLNVGGINVGSWMDYNVNVASAGTYTLNVRVATPNAGGQLQLKAADGTVLGTVTLPATNGWQSWATFTANVTLAAGSQKLRIYDVSGSWNFNWFELVPGSSSTTTVTTTPVSTTASTIKVEAETYVKGNAVMTQTTTDAGGGLNVGGINTGSWMDYSVNIASAGTYTFTGRVATPNTNVQMQVLNSSGTVLATIIVPSTNGWQIWTNVTATLTLPAGTQTIRVSSLTGSWNFNWFQLTSGGTAAISTSPATTGSVSTSSSFTVSPNPFTDNFTISVNNSLTGPMTVQMTDASGAVKKTFNLMKDVTGLTQVYLSATDLTSGTYTITVYMGTWSNSTSITKQ